MKTPAVWVKCPGYESSPHEHDMRDNCWTCAPYWENIPLCPAHRSKLRETTTDPKYDASGHRTNGGKGYCRTCKKHYELREVAGI